MTYDLHLRNQVWSMNDPDKRYVMGVVNVTPDSFYDGGVNIIDENFKKLISEIAFVSDIIDVGGESTRPGAEWVTVEEECRRVIPRIEWIRHHYPSSVISIDTYKVETARRAVMAGADIINDVSSGEGSNDEMFELAHELGVAIILMHMKGKPKNMQQSVHYDQVEEEICQYFNRKIQILSKLNFSHNKIIVDPGIGFGKYLQHNIGLIKNIEKLKQLGYPVLIGASRKSMIGELTQSITDERLYGSIGAHLASLQNGANMVRVHDPVAMRAAMQVYLSTVG